MSHIAGLDDLSAETGRDPFEFYVPLSLAKATDGAGGPGPDGGQGADGDWLVDGPLSSERPDLQGETVLQEGIHKGLGVFDRYGCKVDYDHLSVTRNDPKYIIGLGTRRFQKAGLGGRDLVHLETRLLKKSAIARDVWDRMSEGVPFAYSIGGLVSDRRGPLVRGTVITHVAITPYPVNPDAVIGVSGLRKSLALRYPVGDDDPHDDAGAGSVGEALAAAARRLNRSLMVRDALGERVLKALCAGSGPGLSSVGGRALVPEDLERKPKTATPCACDCAKCKRRRAKAQAARDAEYDVAQP